MALPGFLLQRSAQGVGTGLPCAVGEWLSSCLPCRLPAGYQIAYRLASSSPHTFTTVEVGATVRQFTATDLAPESAYIFRLSAKTRQGWGEPLEATVITTEKRGKTLGDPGVLQTWRAPLPQSGLLESVGYLGGFGLPFVGREGM